MQSYGEGNSDLQHVTKEVERMAVKLHEINDEIEESKKMNGSINNKLDLILKNLGLETQIS